MMVLESLPNEILLTIFDYLSGVDILQAFCNLNYHFNNLLHNQYQRYYFDFRSVSKYTFTTICQQCLPSITNEVISLHLNNDGTTPGQIDLFSSYLPPLTHFKYLRSLSLHSIHSYQLLINIIDQCHNLLHIDHLKFISCDINNCDNNGQLIIDNIWSLSNLTHCVLGISITTEPIGLCLPRVISTSMRYLSIPHDHNRIKLSQLRDFFEHTPHLRYLSIRIVLHDSDNYLPLTYPKLHTLDVNITDISTVLRVQSLLLIFPNLRRLIISLSQMPIGGDQWKNIITNHLPNLEVFQLQMNQTFLSSQGINEKADVLFQSFQSPFWMNERRWFVRCLTFDKIILLYTPSFRTYTNVISTLPDSFRSTCPCDDQQVFYKEVKQIFNYSLFDKILSPDCRLSNIERLSVKMPINDRFWSVVPNLERLIYLIVVCYADIHYDQLQMVCNRSPNLHSLRIHQDDVLPAQMSLFQCENLSLKTIHLKPHWRKFNKYLNRNECLLVSSSKIVAHCEEMSLCVMKRESVADLICSMSHLKALTIECKDDEYFAGTSKSTSNDKLLIWLNDHLPSRCMITRDLKTESSIRVWIG
ncbi:unnamed protein product [Adineta ricciae]|uniref:F-box domain-containing protein n=1 Tax=Adineta ricciae TaxID=249248 RepID=A0A815G874_ADIRI|nr:unnamed protein product [Adineta ricciae]CAF1335920.1 unnamed protein product [Adineta ricciae]